MSLQDAGTAQADVAGGKGKNSLYARWGWLAGPLVIAALCLWHGLDVENSVMETGERWLYGWYAGLAVLALAVTAGLGIELFIRRKMSWNAVCGFCGRTGTDLYAGASATFGS